MTPDRNAWAAIPAMTLVQRGHMPPPEPGAGDVLDERGRPHPGGRDQRRLRRPKIEEIAFQFDYPTPMTPGTRSTGWRSPPRQELPQDEQQAVREAMIEAEAGFRNGDGLVHDPRGHWGVLVSGD